MGQWEIHPWLAREDIVDWCFKHNVVVEAYSPLVQGERADEPVLTALAKKYNKSFAQILIRWSLQKVWFIFSHPIVVCWAESDNLMTGTCASSENGYAFSRRTQC